MPSKKGFIALMGSGEFTSTMVEVYKELLSGLPLCLAESRGRKAGKYTLTYLDYNWKLNDLKNAN
jgi:hypothetical protein